MTYLIVFAMMTVFGLIYAALPERFLRGKYRGTKVPGDVIRSARRIGLLLAALGAVGAAYTLVQGL